MFIKIYYINGSLLKIVAVKVIHYSEPPMLFYLYLTHLFFDLYEVRYKRFAHHVVEQVRVL